MSEPREWGQIFPAAISEDDMRAIFRDQMKRRGQRIVGDIHIKETQWEWKTAPHKAVTAMCEPSEPDE